MSLGHIKILSPPSLLHLLTAIEGGQPIQTRHEVRHAIAAAIRLGVRESGAGERLFLGLFVASFWRGGFCFVSRFCCVCSFRKLRESLGFPAGVWSLGFAFEKSAGYRWNSPSTVAAAARPGHSNTTLPN